MSYYNNSGYVSKVDWYTRSRNRKKAILVLLAIIVLVTNCMLVKVIISRIKTNADMKHTYKEAVDKFDEGMKGYNKDLLDQAYALFQKISDYKDADTYITKINSEKSRLVTYDKALNEYESGAYNSALERFHSLGNYRDSIEYIDTITNSLYDSALTTMNLGEYSEARKLLLMIPEYATNYENAQELLTTIESQEREAQLLKDYDEAVNSFNAENYVVAQSQFMRLRSYNNAESYLNQIGEIFYSAAKQAYDNNDYSTCLDNISLIDTDDEWPGRYNEALNLKNELGSNYRVKIEEKSMKILDNDGYTAFKEFVQGSICEFYSEEEATLLLDAHEPVYLCDLIPYDTGEWESAPNLGAIGFSNDDLEFTTSLNDENGVSHINCLVGGGTYATYHLGSGKYRKLQGNMFIVQGYQSTKENSCFLLVRGADGQDLYRNETYSGFGSVPFSIDISGQEDVTIYFDGLDADFLDYYQYGSVGELLLLP